jgi:titin
VISDNKAEGVLISGAGTSGNLVEGNFIGTDSAGNNTIGNDVAGVLINAGAVNNTIGGTGAGAENVISDNKAEGVLISGAGTSGNLVQGNYIGTNPTGTRALSNQDGVLIQAGAVNNTIGGAVASTIGGTGAGARNVISGNRSVGVAITGAGTGGNVVEGNFIGTQAGGTGPLGNGSAGILINRGATSNTVGGTVPGTGNVIAYNMQAGVRVGGLATAGASILGNSIFANGSTDRGPGIQLTGGANGSELPPTIKSITPGTAGSMTISGTAKPGSRVELFEDATCADPEGRQFIAAVVPMADGNWRVSVALLPAGSGVTATETDRSTLDTSPFSRCSLVSTLSTVSSGSPT